MYATVLNLDTQACQAESIEARKARFKVALEGADKIIAGKIAGFEKNGKTIQDARPVWTLIFPGSIAWKKSMTRNVEGYLESGVPAPPTGGRAGRQFCGSAGPKAVKAAKGVKPAPAPPHRRPAPAPRHRLSPLTGFGGSPRPKSPRPHLYECRPSGGECRRSR